VGRRGTNARNVPLERKKRKDEGKRGWHMWQDYKRYSKRSKGRAQHVSYDEKHRSTVKRIFQMRHAC